jgi:hypothetical protein
VLLAPACSSFDQFHDYEERGRVFKELVKDLVLDVMAGRVSRQWPVVPVAQEPPLAAPMVAEPPREEMKTGAEAPDNPAEDLKPGPHSPETLLEAGAIVEEAVRTLKPEDVVEPAVRENQPAPPEPTSPERPELTYMYEVESVELPPAELEPQEWYEGEATISTSASEAEIAEDGPLPFEMRPKGAALPPRPIAGKEVALSSGGNSQGRTEPPTTVQKRLPGVD